MNRRKGFTLIELIAVILILGIIALIAIPVLIKIIADVKMSALIDTGYGIIKSAENGYSQALLRNSVSRTTYTYNDRLESKQEGDIEISYTGRKPSYGIIVLNKDGQVAIAIYEEGICAKKGFSDSKVLGSKMTKEDCISSDDFIYYNEDKCANSPILAPGMTPVKWTNNIESNTSTTDDDWYDYCDNDYGNWANARTADGSYWVWIPRYVYKMINGWHYAAAGIISVQFTKGTNDNWNESNIGPINTDSTSLASKSSKWSNQPAFKFGEEELPGFWVAKYEASGTSDSVHFIPNSTSLRNMTVGDMFTVSRNMETNSMYGWGTTGTNIDTHLIKNTEWAAVAYLSRSFWGADSEIWINPSSDFITGCSGLSARIGASSGCAYEYKSSYGINSSTTANITGVYDMSGGSGEYVSAYVDNGNGNLALYGSSIIEAVSKYKDVYSVGSEDTAISNYAKSIDKKGDAVYETSDGGNGINGWYSDYTVMPNTNNPWFERGGFYNNEYQAGSFHFFAYEGKDNPTISFRSILVVN